MLAPVCLTYLTVAGKVTPVTAIKKPGAILLVIVSCDYLPSALSRHIPHNPPLTAGPPPLNFIVDYLPECGEEEPVLSKLEAKGVRKKKPVI